MDYPKVEVGKAIDLTSQRFGILEVLYRTENKGPRTMWVCRCDCGMIKPIPAQDLTQHKTISCGCQNRQKASQRMLDYNLSQLTDIIGQRFGKLKVIQYLGLRKQQSRDKNESWYLCQCECGNQKEVRRNDLISGAIISCGCICSCGEEKIKKLLIENQVNFKQEYIFNDLRNPNTNHHLRFDFAIFDSENQLQYLIEFDGRQHFIGPDTTTWTHYSISREEALADIRFRDKLKNEYCKIHNIPLIRIPYTKLSTLTYEDIKL